MLGILFYLVSCCACQKILFCIWLSIISVGLSVQFWDFKLERNFSDTWIILTSFQPELFLLGAMKNIKFGGRTLVCWRDLQSSNKYLLRSKFFAELLCWVTHLFSCIVLHFRFWITFLRISHYIIDLENLSFIVFVVVWTFYRFQLKETT